MPKTAQKDASVATVKKQGAAMKHIKKYWQWYAMMFIPVVYYIVFRYIPMFGNIIAFRRYRAGSNIFGDEWSGLKYFNQFMKDQNFWRAFKNTLLLNFKYLIISFPLTLIFALLLNEVKNVHFKKIVQTISYLPHFISMVIVAGMVREILSTSGPINNLITKLGGEAITFISLPEWFTTIFVTTGVWQGLGWGTILYLAAMSGINTELYEAAELDGANRFQRCLHVTIPAILPTISTLLVLNIGSLCGSAAFEKVFLLYTPTTYETADIIAKTTLTSEVLGNRTVPATAGSWKWEKLRDINFFLQYSSNCADEHVRLEYEGVARFFRAWFYFEKVKHYGDVPWVDRPIDAGDPLLFEKGRDPREMVMQKVIEDLDFAVTNLPVERSVYRVTRWAALALKSRVCLFEGTFRKYHGLKDWESYLTACATASKRFIDESGYSVYTTGTTPYLNLFSSLKALDTEIVLARVYNTAIGLKHDVNGYLTSITMGRPGLLKNIANMYLMKDGTPFTSQPGWETMQLPEESKNRDGRFAQTVRTPGYKRIDDTALSAPNLAATMTGYQLVKYLQSAKYDSYNASTNDLPLLRAAEVMLNYAEAKAELGTLTQEDIDLAIKPLRDRAGVANLSLTKANASPDPYLASPETGYANVTGDNKGVILEIRRERTVELLMENLRYWDIMRWKEGKRFEKPFTGLYFPGTGSYDLNNDGVDDVCIWSGSKPATSAPAVYELNKEIFLSGGDSGYIIIHTDYARSWNEERDYLYPVPTDDRVLTQGAITQNPGWNDGLNF